jgi:leucine dehydrogenase
MTHDLESLIERWDGLAIVSRFDTVSGAWIFICLHDSTLGPCTGGTRMAHYESPAEGLRDAMRLAEGMTCKWAAINEPAGGGKAVLALTHPLDEAARQRLLQRYGKLVDSLNGAFRTGEDLGTTSSDMQVIAEHCRYVHGFHPVDGSKVDPSPFTARAVFEGIKSAAEFAYDSDDLSERSVLVQGVGSVGLGLARLLSVAGSTLLISDIDPERTAETARRPANNQLAEPADAQRLLEKKIVYVPDYIINAGGARSFALMDRGYTDLDAIFEEMISIGLTVREILEEAAERGESPVAAAERRVQETLTGARDS